MDNLTIRGHDVTDCHSYLELPQKIKAYGIKNVQLALGKSFPDLPSGAPDLSPGYGTFIKQQFQQADVQIALLSCYINMIHPNLATREQLLQKFEAYVAHAKYFGASMVASETGNVLPEIQYTEQNFTPAAFELAVASIQRLVKAGEQHNILIGIEPGLNHPIYSLDQTVELLKRIDSPQLGIILDATNLITATTYQEQTALLQRAFDLFGAKIVAIHLKDFNVVNGQIVPTAIGDGVMDLAGMLAIIRQHKPFVYVVMEQTQDAKIPVAAKLIVQS
ncbi:MAG: sugar phosphate isomerase/epimerase [Lactobacillaceae bacterium]|nr:sugar phosphate isomerase/epimerase [Lactobacillaceae bacterium]